ncbi:MAG: peroxiredoxin [archaeon]|nr:peroxiredoxin [archaeon]
MSLSCGYRLLLGGLRRWSTASTACPVEPAPAAKPASTTPHPLVGQDVKKSDVSLRAVDGEVLSTASLLSNKTVVLFGLPGAFSPTCSNKHVPAFIDQAPTLKAKGVDLIACVSINDRFVMDAWGNHLNVGDAVEMLSDYDGSFVKALGLTVDLSAVGLGLRSKRFSLLLKDGRVVHAEVEESPGEYKVSGPEPILARLQADASN